MARAAVAAAAVALQPRRGQAPAVRAAPMRTPLLLSRRSPWTPRGQRQHRLTTSPRRHLQVPPKLSLTFLCTKKEQPGKARPPINPSTPTPLLGIMLSLYPRPIFLHHSPKIPPLKRKRQHGGLKGSVLCV